MKNFAADHTEANEAGWLKLSRRLRRGELETRAARFTDFVWTITAEHGDLKDLASPLKGVIPAAFWIEFFNAEDRMPSIQLPTISYGTDDDFAHRDIDEFSFAASGLLDGAQMRGHARGVKVRRDQIPGIPKGGGRTQGSGGLAKEDWPTVLKAHNHMKKTGCSPNAAATKFGHEMPGDATDDSKISRLNKRLRKIREGAVALN